MNQQEPAKTPMICEKCGAVMNHHAMKIDYGRAESSIDDAVFGGVLQEVHTCPHCGHAQLRPA
jgi:ribosomal protein S27AE